MTYRVHTIIRTFDMLWDKRKLRPLADEGGRHWVKDPAIIKMYEEGDEKCPELAIQIAFTLNQEKQEDLLENEYP